MISLISSINSFKPVLLSKKTISFKKNENLYQATDGNWYLKLPNDTVFLGAQKPVWADEQEDELSKQIRETTEKSYNLNLRTQDSKGIKQIINSLDREGIEKQLIYFQKKLKDEVSSSLHTGTLAGSLCSQQEIYSSIVKELQNALKCQF